MTTSVRRESPHKRALLSAGPDRSGRTGGSLVLVVLAVSCVVLATVACSNTDFTANVDASEFAGALSDAGLEICGLSSTDLDLPGGVGGQKIDVAIGECYSAGHPQGVVVVEEFESENARERALRNAFLQNRQRPYVSPYAHGAFVMRLLPGADDEVLDRYEKAVALLESQDQ